MSKNSILTKPQHFHEFFRVSLKPTDHYRPLRTTTDPTDLTLKPTDLTKSVLHTTTDHYGPYGPDPKTYGPHRKCPTHHYRLLWTLQTYPNFISDHYIPTQTSFLTTTDHYGPTQSSFLTTTDLPKLRFSPLRTTTDQPKLHFSPLRTTRDLPKLHFLPLRTCQSFISQHYGPLWTYPN